MLTQIEIELARELQAAGFLVAHECQLRPPCDEAVPILVRYVDRPELPRYVVASIAATFSNSPKARGAETSAALFRALGNDLYEPYRPDFPEANRDSCYAEIGRALSMVVTKRDLSRVLALLRDPSQPSAAREALGDAIPRLLGREAVELWRSLLHDPELSMRTQAVERLCRLKDRTSLPRMREVVGELEHPGRRKVIGAAVRKLEQLAP